MNFTLELTINGSSQKKEITAESLYWALVQIALDNDFLNKTPDKLTITLLAATAACKFCPREATEGNLCYFCDEAMNEARMERYQEEDDSLMMRE